MNARGDFQGRIDAVRERVSIIDVVGGAVRLSKGAHPRGKCPFHGSRSDSLAVYPEGGRAKCWGCPWHGDAIQFVADYYRLSFVEALERLEGDAGLDGLAAAPVHRERAPQGRKVKERPVVDSATLGRFILGQARPDLDAIRAYYAAAGVPAAMLGADRLGDIGFVAMAPIVPWQENKKPGSVPQAPAIAARIRRPILGADGRVASWTPCGIHVTYLSPDGLDKMKRERRDGSLYPARKMMGQALGGAVLLPGRAAGDAVIDPLAGLFPGEGIETVLCGMAIAGGDAGACGLATLSLDNLQGHPKLWRGGVWPLHAIEPDSDRTPALAFRHEGPVTALVDADMKPLRGPLDREASAAAGRRIFLGLPVVDRPGGRIVQRAITTAERADICAQLTVKAWRAAGSRRVTAKRPRMGLDFRDAARELELAE